MSGEWTPTLLAIHEAMVSMGTFEYPLEPSLVGLTLSGWQLERAKRILAAVESAEAREEGLRRLNEEPTEKLTPKRGWNWLINAEKWHYFMEDGHSLCGRWLSLGGNLDAQDFNDESEDNCAQCRKKLAKIREKEV